MGGTCVCVCVVVSTNKRAAPHMHPWIGTHVSRTTGPDDGKTESSLSFARPAAMAE